MGCQPQSATSSSYHFCQSLKGKVLIPVWIARRARMVGIDSGYERSKRRLSFGEGVEVGGLDPIVPVDAQVVPSEAVYDDQYYVHSGSPARKVLFGYLRQAVGQGAAPGRAEHGSPRGAGARDLQEVPAREGTVFSSPRVPASRLVVHLREPSLSHRISRRRL